MRVVVSFTHIPCFPNIRSWIFSVWFYLVQYFNCVFLIFFLRSNDQGVATLTCNSVYSIELYKLGVSLIFLSLRIINIIIFYINLYVRLFLLGLLSSFGQCFDRSVSGRPHWPCGQLRSPKSAVMTAVMYVHDRAVAVRSRSVTLDRPDFNITYDCWPFTQTFRRPNDSS